MLSDKNIVPTVAVKNINTARSFYEGKLGLKPEDSSSDPAGEGGIRYKSGDTYLYVYISPDNAGTNKATCAGWQTGDLEATVVGLKEKGVTFEHYDMPGVTLEGDIHSMGDEFRAVWFKDPDGNIFAIDEARE